MLLIPALLYSAAAQASAISLPEPIRPEKWIRHTDYPSEALEYRKGGTVWFEVSVDGDGKPYACHVLVSSEVPSLDRISCAAMLARGKFRPALDRSGQPLAGVYRRSAHWTVEGRGAKKEPEADLTLPVSRLPDDAKPLVVLKTVEAADASVDACEVEVTSGSPQLDAIACRAISQTKMPRPLLGRDGAPVRAVRSRRIAFQASDSS
jgi:hypothetical protein